MQTIKRAIDPDWLMNPGKIFDAGNPEDTKSNPVAAASTSLERPKNQ